MLIESTTKPTQKYAKIWNLGGQYVHVLNLNLANLTIAFLPYTIFKGSLDDKPDNINGRMINEYERS